MEERPLRPGPRGPNPHQLQQRRDTDRRVLAAIPYGEAKARTSAEIATASGVTCDRLLRSLARLVVARKLIRSSRPIPWKTFGQGGRHSVFIYHRPTRRERAVAP